LSASESRDEPVRNLAGETSRLYQRHPRVAILLAGVIPFSGFYTALAPFSLYIEWKQRLGINDIGLSVIFAAYISGVATMLIVGPTLARRWSDRPVLLASCAIAVTSCVLLGFSSDAWQTGIARFASGLTTGLSASVGVSNVLSLGHGRVTRFAVSIGSSAVIVGSGIGAFVSGLVAAVGLGSDPVVFGIAAGLQVIALVCVAFAPLRPVAPKTTTHRSVAVKPPTRLIAGAVATFAASNAPTGFFLALGSAIAARAMGSNSTVLLGALGAAVFASAFVGQTLIARIPERLRRTIALALAVGSAVLVLAALTTGSPVLIFVAGFAAGASQGAGQYAAFSQLSKHTSGSLLTRVTAIGFLCVYSTNGILPLILGSASLQLGDTAMALVLVVAIVLLCTTASLLSATKRPRT
jgi:predicted MFS family arabinose efflux permease